MKVLLIQPPTNPYVWGGDAIFIIDPVWSEYLGAGLNDAHDVKVMDMRVEKQAIEDVIKEWGPNVIGMTSYTVDYNSVKRLAKQIKAADPEIRVVVGGYHANGAPQEFMDPDIDVVVPGEGVNTLRELVDTWESKGWKADLSGIKGLAYKEGDNGGMHKTPVRAWPHLDSYKFPDRSLTAHCREHYFDKWMKPVAAITSSYSCPFRCEFCVLWPTTDGKYLARSPESFVDEVATIEEDFVWFTDDEAFIDTRRMHEIADLLLERGIKKEYFLMTRSDSIRRDPALMEKWRKAGLRRVMVGFESIREKDLVDFRKDATTDDNDIAIDILKQNGFEINSNYVLAQDYDQKDFDDLRAYVEKYELPLPLYFILTPFPGTVTWQKFKDQIFLHDYDFYDLLHTVIPPTKMEIEDYYTQFSKLYSTVPPLARGIAQYGEGLDELVIRNLKKARKSMREASSPLSGD